MVRTAARFVTVNTRRLRRRGIRGETVIVALADSAITIDGSDGGRLEFPFEAIARFRAGYEEYRNGPSLSLQLWPRDGSGRLRLREWKDREGYACFVRQGTAALLQSRGTVIVETGAGWFATITVFALFGPLALAAVIEAVRSLRTGGDWVSPALTAFACQVLLLIVGRWIAHRFLPRRMIHATDVERAFPSRR